MWKTTNGFGEEKIWYSQEEYEKDIHKYKKTLMVISDLLTLALESEEE